MKLAIISLWIIFLGFCSHAVVLGVKIIKNKKKEKFINEISSLLDECCQKANEAWGYQNGIQRFLATMTRDHLCKLENISGFGNYLSYVMLRKFKIGEFENFDFSLIEVKFHDFESENNSVKDFLLKIILRINMYLIRKSFVIKFDYIEVRDFHGPQKIYMIIRDGFIRIVFLENLNQFISFEVVIPLYVFLETSNEGGFINQETGEGNFQIFFLKKEGRIEAKFRINNFDNEEFHFGCRLRPFEEAVNEAIKQYQAKK